MLDTNIASHVIRGDQLDVRQRLLQIPMEKLVISAVTEAELRYDVAKRGYPKLLTQAVQLFLDRVDTLPWSASVAALQRCMQICESRQKKRDILSPRST